MSVKKVVLATLVIAALIFAVVGYLEPKTARSSAYIIIPVVILLAGSIYYGRKRASALEAAFRATLSGLDLEYLSLAGSLPAARGFLAGYQVCFTFGRASAGSDWASLSPMFSRPAIFCRYKIPGTANMAFHCAVLSNSGSPALRKLFGSSSPEPGFYLAARPSHDQQENLRLYRRLSPATKAALRAVSAFFGGSCGIARDWQTVMVGKTAALQLAGNDPALLACLDFQVKFPIRTKPEELQHFLELAGRTVGLLSRDLRGS